MVFTKDGFLRLLITIAISAIICIVASLTFAEVQLDAESILKSIALGSIIWFVSETALDLVDKKWAHNILPSYIVMCLIIILGTSAGLYLYGIRDVLIIVMVDIAAVICGMIIAIVNRRRYKDKLNKQLKEFKEQH